MSESTASTTNASVTTASTQQGFVNNQGEANYQEKINLIAQKLHGWSGPVILISHVDPDGDALGSTLGLKRALDVLGKDTTLVLTAPKYLEFITKPGELSPPIQRLPDNCLLAILDVAEIARCEGVPQEVITSAAFSINIDHHGTNNRFGDLACVEPSKAATAQMVKDVVDALEKLHGKPLWNADIATPCLTGILTDTGNFRFGNTTPEVLRDAGDLLKHEIAYTDLTDKLQLRHPDYFKMLGKVMGTVEFLLGGLVAICHLDKKMIAEVGETQDDSSDYVGLIRYAEGVQVAIFLRERDDFTKISVRAQKGVSAQAICMALGGGGHVAAAGAKVKGDVTEAKRQILAATEVELKSCNLL
jgi:bifunctional oligoribonuclease and PAP phosphatase NrnA